MADVRGASGVPSLSAFGGLSSPTPCTPLYINLDSGDLYAEIGGVVVLIGGQLNYGLQVARGLVSGVSSVNKFGHAPSGVQTTATDIWDRADATPTQQIWVAPTAARVHAIASTDDNDGKTGSPSSAGARTLRLWGLTSWTSAETSEDITLNGTSGVNTSNSYVIIHRMKILTCGTTSINIGTITATAASDATVTALIRPNEGQTDMAIYGIPSTQEFYVTHVKASMNDNTAGSRVDIVLMSNETPNTSPLNVRFRKLDNFQLQNYGSSYVDMFYDPPKKVSGPAIIKLQGVASAADMDVFGAFDGYLVTA